MSDIDFSKIKLTQPNFDYTRGWINLPTTGEDLRPELTLNQTDSRLPESPGIT